MNTILKNRIMRRVYYTYALRLTLQPAVWHGFFMLALIIALTYFVSIGNVIQNAMGKDLGSLSQFLLNAVTNTEAWTLLLVGAFIFSLFSLRLTIQPLKRHLVMQKA